MPTIKNRLSVPKAQQETFDRLVTISDDFCSKHLSEEYAELGRYAIAALCRKRPCPLDVGKDESWVCAVLYALGQINFLSDKSFEPVMAMADLAKHFNIATSTAGNKAKRVRKALDMQQMDFTWSLPSRAEKNSMFWTIIIDGYMIDVRKLPRELQKHAYEEELIPFIYADKGKSKSQIANHEKIMAQYDIYREINATLQSGLIDQVWENEALEIALKIGLITKEEQLDELDIEDTTPALDIAIYRKNDQGSNMVIDTIDSLTETLNSDERLVYSGMSKTIFSIFEVIGKHEEAGTRVKDLYTDDTFWMVDHGLEVSAQPGMLLSLRIFRPKDFWIGTGNHLIIIPEHLKKIEKMFPVKSGERPDPDQLALVVFQDYYSES